MDGGIVHDLFGPGSDMNRRFIKDYQELKVTVDACRQLGLKIVATSGTYDLLHIGHGRYLELAKAKGDILIVGVDSDEKVKARKGPHRPIDKEMERLEMLCHLRHVDLVFLKGINDPHWEFIRCLRPDVFVGTVGEYTDKEVEELRGLCGEVVILERQAPASTTGQIRLVLLQPVSQIRQKFDEAVEMVNRVFDDLLGGGEQ